MQQQRSTNVIDNVCYNLVSTLHHSLEAEQAYAMYLQDAQATGNKELITFFQNMSQQQKQCAEQAKNLLAQQITRH